MRERVNQSSRYKSRSVARESLSCFSCDSLHTWIMHITALIGFSFHCKQMQIKLVIKLLEVNK